MHVIYDYVMMIAEWEREYREAPGLSTRQSTIRADEGETRDETRGDLCVSFLFAGAVAAGKGGIPSMCDSSRLTVSGI